ncbi:MAG: DUF2892 domain-containing protein [Anaerolineae bacterium]
MTQNVGGFDRIARIIIGIVLLAAAFMFLSGTMSIIAAVLGVVMLVTAAIGWCPLYLPFKLSTRR